MANTLAERYRKAMQRSHPFGYALYEPPPFDRLFPGVLGYLDELRTWHPLLDLTQRPILDMARGIPTEPQRYGEFSVPVLKTPDSRYWGPKVSTKVSEKALSITGSADALALGLPVNVGGAIEYQSGVGFGAILQCEDKVVAEGFDIRQPFLNWVKKNSAALVEDFPELKRHGAYIATWTYSATNIHITTWDGKEHKVVLGFTVGATGIGGLGPERTWSRGRSSSAWSNFNTGEKRAVFFTGIKVKYGLFRPREEIERKWRGQLRDKFLVRAEVGEAGPESCMAEVEFFGDDYEKVLKGLQRKQV